MPALKSLKSVQIAVLGLESNVQSVQIKESEVLALITEVLKSNRIKTIKTEERRRSKGLWLLVKVRVKSQVFSVDLSLNPTVGRKLGSDVEPFGIPVWKMSWGGPHKNSTKTVLGGVEASVRHLCDTLNSANAKK
jgi:hypothetical protein